MIINEHAEAWLRECETTHRPKAKGHLFDTDGCACMLGEAMILEYGVNRVVNDGFIYAFLGRHTHTLSPELWEKLGLLTIRRPAKTISWMNDLTNLSKAEIAAIIRAKPEDYFKCL